MISKKAKEAIDILSAEYFPSNKVSHYGVVYDDENKCYIAKIGEMGKGNILKKVWDDRVVFEYIACPEGNSNKGYGRKWFDAVITKARLANKNKIELNAVKYIDQNDNMVYNGYYVWARYGFDAKLPKNIIYKANKDGFNNVLYVSHLMATKEGQKWWYDNGETIDMTFNLDKNSKHSKYWNYYKKEKGDI